MAVYKIGEVARACGTSAPTIRYYERIGLVPAAERQNGNQRRYTDDDVGRLVFIRRCRDVGFSIDRVRALSAVTGDSSRSCTEAREIAYSHLVEIRSSVRELRKLESVLAGFVASCDAECVGGPADRCCILEELAQRKGSAGCCSARAHRPKKAPTAVG